MATVYEIKASIVSDFCNYSESDIQLILLKLIEDYRNPKNGLQLRINDLVVKKVR